jgi:hypothetical protein
MGGVGTAESVYGTIPSVQPGNTAAGAGAPAGAVSPARTTGRTSGHTLQNPTLWLVIALGAAIGLIHFSVRIGK